MNFGPAELLVVFFFMLFPVIFRGVSSEKIANLIATSIAALFASTPLIVFYFIILSVGVAVFT